MVLISYNLAHVRDYSTLALLLAKSYIISDMFLQKQVPFNDKAQMFEFRNQSLQNNNYLIIIITNNYN